MNNPTAFGIETGYLKMEDHPPLGRRNLMNLALLLWVPIPAVGCCLLLFGWFPEGQIPADPGLIWPESFDQAAALLLHHPVLTVNLLFFLFVDIQFFLIALVQKSTWLIDPYWTLLPPLMALFFFANPLSDPSETRALLCLLLLGIWSIRLTGNYFRRERWRFGFREDWRYAKMRRERRFFVIEQIFVVYLAQHAMLVGLSLPFFAVAFFDVTVGFTDGFLFVGACIGLVVAGLADRQLDLFMRENARRQESGEPRIQLLDSGVWHYSRHPNYFGEQLFWWCIAGFGMICGEPWVVIGTAFNSCVLAGVTVMTERRMLAIPARRAAFQAYQARTSVWIPWWPRTTPPS